MVSPRGTAEAWRLTVAPRVDPGTVEVYGIHFYLRRRGAPA